MSSTMNVSISGESLIPDVLRRYPKMRAVLDRYGLKGCGGPDGPHESVRVFARAHGVDLESLIKEMSAADASSEQPAESPAVDLGDVIYRRFFLAAVVFLLSIGASWGAHILGRISSTHNFTAVSSLQIQAHGQAQVFGWMCLVIMGFAYQAFPRFWHTSLANSGRANLSFWLMAVGVTAAAVGIPFAGAPWALPVAMMGATCELSAAVLFAIEIVATFRRSNMLIEPYVAYIACALGWFALSAILNVVHIWAMMMNALIPTYGGLIDLIQSPMRDVQFHGIGMTIILGVSLRTLPHIFGVRKPTSEFEWGMLAAITSAVCMEVASAFFKLSFGLLPAFLLFVVAVASPIAFRLWDKFPDGDRSEKFIKAGWCWLVVSQTMLLIAPAYFSMIHLIDQHAYIGAIRHAITVGFISLMIMGYGAKVVATLNGYDSRRLSDLLMPFALVNLGCAMRVFGQVLTDVTASAFPIIGMSGVLETTGMAIWGVHIARLILLRRSTQPAPASQPAPQVLDETMMVGEIIDWYPQTIPVFKEFGFAAVVSPLMRRTVGRQVTVEKACSLHGVDLKLFVLMLNSSIAERTKCLGCTGDGCGEEKPETERCH